MGILDDQGTQLYSSNPDAPTSYGGGYTEDPSWWQKALGFVPTREEIRRILTSPLATQEGLSSVGKGALWLGTQALPGVGLHEVPEAAREFQAAHKSADPLNMGTAALKMLNAGLSVVPGVGFANRVALAGAKELQAGLRGVRGAERIITGGADEAQRVIRGGAEHTGAFAADVPPVRGQTAQEIARMQEQLPPEILEAIDKASRTSPQFAEASKFLLPHELTTLVKSPEGIANFQKMLDVIPSSANMVALAKAGAPKQGWYRGSTQALIDVFGNDDAPRFASLLASTSPQVSVESNLLNSLNIWKNWTAAGRPTDPKAIKEIMGRSVQGTKGEESVLNAWVNNATASLTADDPLKLTLSGPKVNSFFRNLADDVYRVTNDAWMANVTGMNQDMLRQSPTALQLRAGNPGYTPSYLAMNARTREASDEIGFYPSEGQESIWSFAKPLMEMQDAKGGAPARELLQQGRITPDVIRGTPDFATLLRDPTYRRVLEDSGYDLSTLRPTKIQQTPQHLTPGDMRELEVAAKRLEDLAGTRARESRSYAMPRAGQPTAFAYSPFEVVPGPGTGHMEGVTGAPYGKRENLTGRAASAFQDMHAQDILLKSLGMDTVATRSATGVYPSGNTIQVNPLRVPGAEVRLTEEGVLSPLDNQRLRTAATIRGGMLAQNAMPFGAQVPDAAGANITIPLKKKADPQLMSGLLSDPALRADVQADKVALVDTGSGVNVLNLGRENPFKPSEAEAITKGLLAKKYAPTREAADTSMNYVDLGNRWKAGVGSREVSRQIRSEITALEKLDPGALKRLDTPELRDAATQLIGVYRGQEKAGEKLRPDVMNMLQKIAEGGLEGGLLKALKSRKELLPAIAATGLTGYLLDAHGRSQAEDY